MQNKIMEKEVLIHQRTKHEMQAATAELKTAILSMRCEVFDNHVVRRHSKLVAKM